MNKITVCTAAWKRPEVFEKWLQCWLILDPVPFVVVVGSPGDQCQELAEHYGAAYFQKPNLPVGEKWNYAHQIANGTCDYFLTTGSDDVMDQRMWDYYLKFTGERLCLRDLYFYDTVSKSALHWKGYPQRTKFNHPIGAHQLHRADVMNTMNYRPFNDGNMGDESFTQSQCERLGIKSTVVSMEQTGGVALDIKSRESYSKFKRWPNSFPVEVDKLRRMSPEMMEVIL